MFSLDDLGDLTLRLKNVSDNTFTYANITFEPGDEVDVRVVDSLDQHLLDSVVYYPFEVQGFFIGDEEVVREVEVERDDDDGDSLFETLDEGWTRGELENKTKDELKDILRDTNKPISGNKSELIERILDE